MNWQKKQQGINHITFLNTYQLLFRGHVCAFVFQSSAVTAKRCHSLSPYCSHIWWISIACLWCASRCVISITPAHEGTWGELFYKRAKVGGEDGGDVTDLSARFAPACQLVEVTECSCSLRKFPFIKSPSCGKHMTRSHTDFVGEWIATWVCIKKIKNKKKSTHLFIFPS